jgi:diaminohydroxyphosphoribosylaminopyrimidine deaminase/5-amino-6-(5-phosphoribosylamino)uracil reductase
MSHQHFLHRCLELAAHGRAKTGINPMVGAVLVRDEKIIGEGFHSEFGKEHAERQLVQK